MGQWTTTSGRFVDVPRRQQNAFFRRLPWKCTLHTGAESLNLLKCATMTTLSSDTAMSLSEVGIRRRLRHARMHVELLGFVSKRDLSRRTCVLLDALQMKHFGLRGISCNVGRTFDQKASRDTQASAVQNAKHVCKRVTRDAKLRTTAASRGRDDLN